MWSMSTSPIHAVIERWHAHMRGELANGLDVLLDDDVVFYSPIVYTPQRGKAITTLYLQAAGQTLPGEKSEPGDQGSPRVIYAATATGKSTTTTWLNDTVDHPRDARIELLAKFVLRNRCAMNSKQLATRQRKLFERQAANLQVAANSATDDVRLVALWRVENINAMIRLLDVVVTD